MILDSARRNAELVEPQSYTRGHKSSSDHITSSPIAAGGLRSWVQLRKAKEDGCQGQQEGWQRQVINCLIIIIICTDFYCFDIFLVDGVFYLLNFCVR